MKKIMFLCKKCKKTGIGESRFWKIELPKGWGSVTIGRDDLLGSFEQAPLCKKCWNFKKV